MPIPFDDTKSLRNALSVVRTDVEDLNRNITILKANNPTNLSIPTINSHYGFEYKFKCFDKW